MTKISEPVQIAALRAMLATLADFHSQQSLQPLETQLAGTRGFLRPVLGMLSWLRRSQVGLILMLSVMILATRKPWFANGPVAIYTVSLTPNNTRVLDQLGMVLRSADLPFAINDAAFAGHRRGLLKDIGQVAQVLRTQGDARTFVFLHQLLGAVYLRLFDADLAVADPQMVVAANDHSPPTVALFALARAKCLRSCYLQHGPVTPSFPPLTTDLALLFSAQAQAAYQAAAHARGVTSQTQVLILPALMDPHVPMRTPTYPLRICLALSFFTELAPLAALLAQLRADKTVGSILISQHPRSTQDISHLAQTDQVQFLPKATLAKDIAPQVDICLVGNSGVAIEFLHYGVPTFYIAPQDPALEDYYGFVAAGLLPQFTPEVLATPVQNLAFFEDRWKAAMTEVNPVFGCDPAQFQQAVLAAFQTRLTL